MSDGSWNRSPTIPFAIFIDDYGCECVKISFNYVHLFITYMYLFTCIITIIKIKYFLVVDQMYKIPVKDFRNK